MHFVADVGDEKVALMFTFCHEPLPDLGIRDARTNGGCTFFIHLSNECRRHEVFLVQSNGGQVCGGDVLTDMDLP